MKFTSAITVELIQQVGTDSSVVHAARVSTAGAACQQVEGDDFQLINYLMKHRHGSPFEHNLFTFFVHAPIFVWREWHRHRIGFSYNEESARYKTLDPVFYVPDDDRPIFKVEGWKPGRPKFKTVQSIHDQEKLQDVINNLKSVYVKSYQEYLHNLELGIDPGLARDCLPVGIYSSCWVTCNARSIMSFLSLRTHDPNAKFVSYPLWEIDQAASQVEMFFAEKFPLTHRAFIDNGRTAP